MQVCADEFWRKLTTTKNDYETSETKGGGQIFGK